MQPNEKVGRLTLLEPRQIGKTKKWLCRCECGTRKEISEESLRLRRTNSCGCLRTDLKRRLMGNVFRGRPA